MKTKLISILALAIFVSHLFAADSALKVAITAQSYDKVKAALDAGADPNEILGGSTILSWAATWGCQANMVKLLIEKGAKVDGVGSMALTPLSAVVWEKNSMPGAIVARNMKTNEKMLKRIKKEVLIANGWWAESDSTKFSTPAEIAKVLLDAGANPNYVLGAGLVKIGTPFLDAVKDFRMDLVKVMLDSKRVDTEYRFDQWVEGTLKMVNVLEAGKWDDKKAALDWATIPKSNTPLLYAIEKQNLELVKILVEGGAYINMGKKVENKNWEFWFPLDVAQSAKNPNKEIIDYLISKGAQNSKIKD